MARFDQMDKKTHLELAAKGGRHSAGKKKPRLLSVALNSLLNQEDASGATNASKLAKVLLGRALEGDANAFSLLSRLTDGAYWGKPITQDEDESSVPRETIRRIVAYLDFQHENKAPIIFVYGTTRSGKTYAICQWLVDALERGAVRGSILVAGMTFPFLRNGAAKYFTEICANRQGFTVLDSGRVVKHSNGEITCQAFDRPEKTLSAQWSLVFLNEGNAVPKEVVNGLRTRTAGMTICDFNPSVSEWWGKDLISDNNKLFCSFKDNPFLSETQISVIEEIRERGENAPAGSYDWWYYQVYYLGNFAEMGGGVFTRVKRATEDEWDARPELLRAHGVDFGDTNDPNALVCVWVDVSARVLWVKCQFYETATDDIQFCEILKQNNVQRLIFETATGGNTRARNFKKLGYAGKLYPCEKEQVSQGVFNLCAFEIRCFDEISYNEFRGYRIENGKFRGADHAIDATRYVARLLINGSLRQ